MLLRFLIAAALCLVLMTLAGCSLLGRKAVSVEGILASTADYEPPPARDVASVTSPDAGPRLQWPLRRMVLSSPFGERNGTPHQGVDLEAVMGTPIYASSDGLVVYSGSGISGYGNTVVVKHVGQVATLYAHASEIWAEEGQSVLRGQPIARVGDSGNATGPHLHFEVRVHTKPVDPWSYVSIPKRLPKLGLRR